MAFKEEVVRVSIRYDKSVPGDTCEARHANMLLSSGDGITTQIKFGVPSLMRAPVSGSHWSVGALPGGA